MNLTRICIWVGAAAVIAGCGATNGTEQLPPQTTVNLQNVGKLQFAVGTARLADGTVGLNVVTTFRQTNGLSATLVNSPAIAGPSGFTVPSTPSLTANGNAGSGNDAGTSSMTPVSQASSIASPSPPPTTFGASGGAFASGLAPLNETEGGGGGAPAYYPGNVPSGAPSPAYLQPFFAANYDAGGTPLQPFILGPPSVPFFNDGTYPGGFAGYLSGFTAFEVPPIGGQYTMTVNVAAVNTQSATYSANATLASTTALPALPAPTFTSDGRGGGTASIVVPAGLVETIVYIVDTNASSNTYYSSSPLTGSGTLTFQLPDNLGKCTTTEQNCENNAATAGPSLATGDSYTIYAAGFDYKQFEAEPPGNLQQTPAITGSNGQADVTLSPALKGTY